MRGMIGTVKAFTAAGLFAVNARLAARLHGIHKIERRLFDPLVSRSCHLICFSGL
jgi:hypothetical protein